MTTWHWLRHGPTHAKCFVGWTDMAADLSDSAQISRLQTRLPKEALVVSSDLIRAKTTADAIQQGRQRLPDAQALREINFGDWEGKTFTQIAAQDPELSRLYWTDPAKACPPNGEHWHQVSQRVHDFVERINQSHPDRHIIAVAHLGVILTQLQRVTDMQGQALMRFSIDNFSLTQLEYLNPGWRVLGVNHVV